MGVAGRSRGVGEYRSRGLAGAADDVMRLPAAATCAIPVWWAEARNGAWKTHLSPVSILPRLTQYHTSQDCSYTSGVADSFGDRLRTLRTRRELTPSGLAHAVGVTEGAIRQMESGQTKSASFIVGLKISHELGVSPWFLATGRDALPESGSPVPDRASLALLERLSVQVSTIDRRVKALEARRRGGTRKKGQE